MSKRICSVEGCDRPADGGQGWCNKHYLRWRKHGDPLVTLNTDRAIPAVDRWLALAGTPSGPHGCRLWLGETDIDGYGQFVVPRAEGGGHVRAHRWGYEHFVGPIDETLDHFVCDTPPCVEWTHVRPESRARNTQRARARSIARRKAGQPSIRRPALIVVAERLTRAGIEPAQEMASAILGDLRSEGFRVR